jgi:hypothetical protein
MWIQCKSDPRSQFINLPNPKSHQILGLLDLQKNKDGPRKWRLSLPCSNDYMIFWHSWCLLSVPSTSLGANELDKSSKQKILKLKKMSTCNISNIIWNTASQKPKLIYLYLHIYIYTLSLSPLPSRRVITTSGARLRQRGQPPSLRKDRVLLHTWSNRAGCSSYPNNQKPTFGKKSSQF